MRPTAAVKSEWLRVAGKRRDGVRRSCSGGSGVRPCFVRGVKGGRSCGGKLQITVCNFAAEPQGQEDLIAVMRSSRDERSIGAFGGRNEGHGFIEPSQALSW